LEPFFHFALGQTVEIYNLLNIIAGGKILINIFPTFYFSKNFSFEVSHSFIKEQLHEVE